MKNYYDSVSTLFGQYDQGEKIISIFALNKQKQLDQDSLST
jgi:hypothetical protein